MVVQYFLRFSHATTEPQCLLSLNGDILAFNPAMTVLTGCHQQQIAGMAFKGFLLDHENSLERYLKTVASSTDTTPGALHVVNMAKQGIECQCYGSLMMPVHSSDRPCLLLRIYTDSQKENVFTHLNAELEVLRRKHHELRKQKEQLSEYVKERTERLYQEIKERKAAQATLVRAEKMAALGSLVSGVAHEINTPIGIGVTGTTHLEDITRHFRQLFTTNAMKKSDLSHFLDECEETSHIIHSNLQRASELIHSFKQVAVDQSSEERRRFNIKSYLEEVLLSLYPAFKKTLYTVTLECPEDLDMDSYPGAFSQILTNLVMNSLIHGFEDSPAGKITLEIKQVESNLHWTYKDDGKGMSTEYIKKVFDPFFTTKRGSGGSGLGMNVVYNLVCERLGGTIECNSNLGHGIVYQISIPMT